jgi:hypothetical protein
MTTDFQRPEPKREPSKPIEDPFRLPEIVSVAAHKVKSEKPWVRVVKGKELKHNEAVQFTVETSGDFPITAYSPALYVGDVRVDYWVRIEENRYAFLAFEVEKLEEGAPIWLGWFNVRPPEKTETKFHYRLE